MFYRFDVGHPKQARQTKYLIESLGLSEDEYFVSARGALDADRVAKALGLDPLVVGGHHGDLYRKLVDDLYRAKRLADFVQVLPKDTVLISFGMPSGIRVAFGLGIPIIHVNDTPHNEPVRRLTASLSDYIVTPRPEAKNRRDTPPRRSIVPLYGVPEMSYVPLAEDLMPGKPLEEAKKIVEDRSPFVFFRYAERKSSYAVGGLRDFYETFETVYRLAKEYDLNLIIYKRYPDERLDKPDVYVLDKIVNVPYLLRHATLVVSSGGSIAKEAALQGVPVVVMHYRLDSTERLAREGFPLFDARRRLIETIQRVLEDPRRRDVDLTKYDKLDAVIRRCLESL